MERGEEVKKREGEEVYGLGSVSFIQGCDVGDTGDDSQLMQVIHGCHGNGCRRVLVAQR